MITNDWSRYGTGDTLPLPVTVGEGAEFIAGRPVLVTSYAVEWVQHRFPRSKRKRIRKKWAANECNGKYVPAMVITEHQVMVHPEIVKTVGR